MRWTGLPISRFTSWHSWGKACAYQKTPRRLSTCLTLLRGPEWFENGDDSRKPSFLAPSRPERTAGSAPVRLSARLTATPAPHLGGRCRARNTSGRGATL
ncbi:hypothetical protein B0T12DRAFT_260807 [Alternaria alternata]|nr:hypothetical protein B0T12DRAFT_260807 [Alternaria alternata]